MRQSTPLQLLDVGNRGVALTFPLVPAAVDGYSTEQLFPEGPSHRTLLPSTVLEVCPC